MNKQQKRRFSFVVILLGSIAVATSFALLALRQDINLYYTPREVFQHAMAKDMVFRLGGMVVPGSVHHAADSLRVEFALTDYHKNINVIYEGILPSLFHEGQGIVAQGHMNAHGFFIADQVLAKHDSTYKPPKIK